METPPDPPPPWGGTRQTCICADRAIGTIQGRAWSILLSPSKDRVLVHRSGRDMPLSAAVVDLQGRVTVMEPGWTPLGWQGRDRVLLVEREPPARLAVAEVETGSRRVFSR